MKEAVVSTTKRYILPVLLGLVAVGLLFYANQLSDKKAELTDGVTKLEELKAENDALINDLAEPYDQDEHVEVIESRTITAENIAKELIAMDDALTAFYQTNEPLPEDEAERKKVFAELEAAQQENTRLTGAGDADHIDTWKLNPEWTTTLETVVTYQDAPQVPVLFSMKTKDGKNAGVVYGTFNAERNMLTNITKHYTSIGMQDAVDVGGI